MPPLEKHGVDIVRTSDRTSRHVRPERPLLQKYITESHQTYTKFSVRTNK